jgi:hypothetical protein
MAVSANRLEILQIADAVAREKSIDRSIVIASMEDALQKAARSRYGQETEVRAEKAAKRDLREAKKEQRRRKQAKKAGPMAPERIKEGD